MNGAMKEASSPIPHSQTTRSTRGLISRIESPLDKDLLLDLKEFTVRPMDRAMNTVRQKNLTAIDPEAAAA